ncbi:Alpha/Beta hydrolase protein [Fimicolochytrium jonesii]|uniref:Alpha/Beta hydrolase protein n=1 Tax=Fimicolochytrium jonesii TaxID=1396493 RepID=UPI0022FE086B|nr:Alpha/Beta hydrolase protein [Fimicolochytrium jonesii]KAI8819753.1 Alpha/Beta hydrolase protein [Fimicolochytrium jonesii]
MKAQVIASVSGSVCKAHLPLAQDTLRYTRKTPSRVAPNMEARTFEYKIADGAPILADVHWKAKDSSDNIEEPVNGRPVAVVFHQGGFILGSKNLIPKAQIRSLTNLGFVVVVANYRLCPQVSVYDGPFEDAKDALEWIRNDVNRLLSENSERAPTVDPTRVVSIGYSAGGTLALLLGTLAHPVRAVLDFYGGKVFTDPSWTQPLPGFLKRPPPDEAYAKKVFAEPTISATEVIPGSTAPPTPRASWMTLTAQRGTWLREVVKDGKYDRVDPVALATAAAAEGKTFPPTFIIHGTADEYLPYHLSVIAKEKLEALGVDVTLVPVEGKDHLFDLVLTEEDELYRETIAKGFEFLAKRV